LLQNLKSVFFVILFFYLKHEAEAGSVSEFSEFTLVKYM